MTLDFKLPKRAVNSLLGLTLEGRQLEGVVLRRAQGGFRVEQSFETSLSLDPLTNDPVLVGQEIRNRLDEAGIREKRCAVGVPLNWAMTSPVKVPDIPEEDVESFLGIQAEKSFPYGLEDLLVATSRFRASPTVQYATLVAIPRNHLSRLEEILTIAKLKPLSFSLGIVALQPPQAEGSEGILALVAGENNVDLQVASGGGLVALRSLQGAIESDGGGRQVDVDLLNREIRLTLGQIPQECGRKITRIRVFGRPQWRQALADAIAPTARRLGLQMEVCSVSQIDGVGTLEPAGENSSLALVMAARCLQGELAGFEFLPPKVSKWTELTARFSSARVLYSSAAAGAIVVLVGGAFLAQYIQLSILERRWTKIEPTVNELKRIEGSIREFRGWSPAGRRSLAILRKLADVFPEDGALTAKTIEIRNVSEVSCTGIAQDNQAYLKMSDRLKAATHVGAVKTPTVGNKRFSVNFSWQEGGGREN